MNAMTNLSRKEYRDAREVLIGGIAIFWVVPIILELLFLAIGRERETFPFVWVFLALVGWFYAVVSGAHTVCRDWGKAEEHFLLSMPVSAQQVIWAKLKVGAVILLVVLLLAAAWDFSMDHWGMFGSNWHATNMPMVRLALLWGWVFVVGYTIGFTAAVVTRQMLASTLVGCLALLIWLVAPLISSHLQFLRPNWWNAVTSAKSFTDASWLGAGWPFVTLTVLGLVTCVGTALICCTRERVIRLGHKQLAWMVALVVLTLLGLALGEVGNSLVVRAQAEILPRGQFWDERSAVACRGDQFYAASAYPAYTTSGRGHASTVWRVQLAAFRLDEHGQIKDLRQASLPDKYTGWAEINGLAVEESGEVVMTLNYDTYGDNGIASLLRLQLWWPSDGPLQVTGRTAIKRPGNWPNISPVNRNWVNTASRYAYFQTYISEDPRYVPSGENTLYVYDWFEGPNPQPLYEIQLPSHTYARMYRGGELWIGQSNLSSNRASCTSSWIPNRQLDPDHPELLLEKSNLTPDRDAIPPEQFLNEPVDRCADRRGDLWCVSDQFGLRVLRHTRPQEWEPVGEYRASPLALRFRHYGDHQPKFLNEALVLENSPSQLALYNVSDPAHPRRIGFFQQYDGQVYPTPHFLLVLEGNLLTVLDRPAR